MEGFLRLDTQVFLLINHLPHNALFNAVGLGLSAIGTAGIVWLFIAGVFFVFEEKKDHFIFAPLLLTGATSWILVEKILKPLITRPRPTAQMGAIILGLNLTDSYSFPSGHATIAWALAGVLANKEPKWKWGLYLLATLISFSRIYIGKHYPLDVIVGGLAGWGIGAVALYLTKRFQLKSSKA